MRRGQLRRRTTVSQHRASLDALGSCRLLGNSFNIAKGTERLGEYLSHV